MAKKLVYLIILFSIMLNTFGILMVNASIPNETITVVSSYRVALSGRDATYYSNGVFLDTEMNGFIFHNSLDVYNGMIFNVTGIPNNATIRHAYIEFYISVGNQDVSGAFASIYSAVYNNMEGWNASSLSQVDFTDFGNVDFSSATYGDYVNSSDLITVVDRIQAQNPSVRNGMYEFVMVSAPHDVVRAFENFDSSVIRCPELYIEYTYERPVQVVGDLYDELPNGYFITEYISSGRNYVGLYDYDRLNYTLLNYDISSLNLTLGVEYNSSMVSQRNQNAPHDLILVGDYVYALGYNRSDVTELIIVRTLAGATAGQSWEKVTSLSSSATWSAEDWVYDLDNQAFHVFYALAGEIYYRNCTLINGTWTVGVSQLTVNTAGGTSGGVNAYYSSSEGRVYVGYGKGSTLRPQLSRSTVPNPTAPAEWEKAITSTKTCSLSAGSLVSTFVFNSTWYMAYFSGTAVVLLENTGTWTALDTGWTVRASYSVFDAYRGYVVAKTNVSETYETIHLVGHDNSNELMTGLYYINRVTDTYTMNCSGGVTYPIPMKDGDSVARVVWSTNGAHYGVFDIPIYVAQAGVTWDTLETFYKSFDYGASDRRYTCSVPYSVVGVKLYLLYDDKGNYVSNSTNSDDLYPIQEEDVIDRNYEELFEDNMDIIMVLIAIIIIVFGCGGGIAMGILSEAGFLLFMTSLMVGAGLIITFLEGGF